MYLSRSSKPLKPYKPGAKGIVSDKSPTYPGAQPAQKGQPKEAKIRVPGKNVPKRKPRVQATPVVEESEYDVNAVRSFIDRQGAAEPEYPPTAPPKPMKSSKIGLPKKVGASTKIQPKTGTVKSAPEPTPAPDPKKMIIKKKKDEQLLSRLITSVEPKSDTESDEDLVQQALDGEYSDKLAASESEVDDDDLMSE